MKKILRICLLLALCLSLCACDLTLDVQEGGSKKGSATFWKKEETTAATNNSQSSQTVQQENQTQQTATQPTQNQQYVQQPNTYVPAVTIPEAETYATMPVISGLPDTEMVYDGGYSNLEYWITYCDTLYLNDTYLYGMSAAECRIARNAIYAKSGRIFTSSDLSNYFSHYSWYSPRIHPNNFSNTMLNAAQLHNLNVIIAYEEQFG